MPNDPNDSPQTVSNSTPDAVSGTPVAQPAPDAQQPAAATPATGAPNAQPQSQPQPNAQPHPTAQYSHLSQDGQYGWDGKQWQPIGTVSNTPPPPAIVRHASVLREVAETLAGGPRYQTTIDPNTGATTRTPVPLSKKDIGLSIALAALSGGLAGLSATGPGAVGKAGLIGLQQGQQIAQQRQAQQQQQDQQARQDQQDQTKLLAQRASIYEANSRTLLNTSEAEQHGADAIDKLAEINRQSGVLDVSPELLDNGGQAMTQAELTDAMKSGKLSPTDQLGPVAGRVEVTRPDGSKYWEATHLIVRDPNTKVTLSQADFDRYAAGNVRGFPPGTKLGPGGYEVPLRVVANANEQLSSHYLANQRLSNLRNVLDGTEYAKSVPSAIDFSKPGVDTALQHVQRYVSHNADNLSDPYLALQAMGAAKRDPKTGEMQPNPDAKYVDTAAQAMGGWNVLEAAHNQIAANKKTASDFAVIDSDAKANAVLAAPKRFSPDQVSAANAFLTLDASEKKAIARASAEGRESVKPQAPEVSSTPDALGFTPTITEPKEASKRFASFKRNLDSLAQTDQTYKQFQDGLDAIKRGDWNGAQSVVDLFSAIGLSAAPLQGKGFRVNQNVIAEHTKARGLAGEIQARLQGLQTGAIITAAQLQQYADIAANARLNQYVSLANQFHNAGLPADAALPTGNGQRIDIPTAKIFLALTGGNQDKAKQAAQAKGWTF